MDTSRVSRPNPPQTLPEAVVRTLRHEVGDLLQTVYATVAVLQQRIPEEWDLERRILADMRTRAEACKGLLDIAHDLVCPVALNLEPVNLAEILSPVIAAAAARHPNIKVEKELAQAPAIQGDLQKLTQVARTLVAEACQAAAARVRVTLAAATNEQELQWTVQRDGAPIATDQIEQFFNPAKAGYQRPTTLALMHVRKIIELHGGRVFVADRSEGGLIVTVLLPLNQEEHGWRG